ncbi:MAG: hypothetical protein HY520_04875 [Candidatus Aenigmarchaeota archaeon]|nr:hypothetical protein [Candidatus Aenigmarchaeota archaeon]
MPKREWSVVGSRLPKDLQTALMHYCAREGVNPSSFVRSLLEAAIDDIVPVNKAGAHDVRFDPARDCFSWIIAYDDGLTREVAASLSPAFLENLSRALRQALDARSSYLQQRRADSVAIPARLKRLKGRGDLVKG